MQRLKRTLVSLSAATALAALTAPGIGAEVTKETPPPPPVKKQAAPAHKMMNAADLKWGPAPPGLPAAVQATVLDGDPTKPGLFTVRLKAPDGTQIMPHWHPVDEHVTVLSGALMVGMGQKWDDAAMRTMDTGGHARIARLLGIQHFALAVNKMDLVDFDRDVFEGIATDFSTLLEGRSLYPIPVSALHGDNVIARSDRTPWFDGPSLLEYLETVEVAGSAASGAFRFPVQLVSRPDQDFRGYAGQIFSGTVRVGDTVTAWPSVRSSRVRRIVTWDGELDVAFAPMSVTLVLENELDVSRGDIIVNSPIHMGKRFKADVVWMDERPLEPNRLYVIKHASGTTTAQVDTRLLLNDISRITIETSRALVYDKYSEHRGTGSFILIEPTTNFTAGAGMIAEHLQDAAPDRHPGAAERLAHLARTASSEGEAIEAVRRALEELLT